MDFTLLAVFLTGFFATLLSSMSGGGASLIAVPVFLMMGLPLLLIIAIQNICGAFWVLPAGRNYLRGRKVEWRFLIGYTLIGLIGVVIGITFLVRIPQRVFEICFGLIILVLVAWLYLNKQFGLKRHRVTARKRKRAFLAAFPQGAYEAVFGSGNGIFFTLVGVKLRGYELSEALGYYYVISFAWVGTAAALLIAQGNYNLPIMATAIIGSIAGGYLGSKFGRYKGNAFVKTMFCIIGLVLGLKLVFFG